MVHLESLKAEKKKLKEEAKAEKKAEKLALRLKAYYKLVQWIR